MDNFVQNQASVGIFTIRTVCCAHSQEKEKWKQIVSDTAQGKDAPRGNFLLLYAEYQGRYNKI